MSRFTPLARAWALGRRAVLRRRRGLAAACCAVAVGSGVYAVAPPRPVTVPVTTAARDLPSGTVLGADDLATTAFRPASVPSALAADPMGRTLAAPVRRGEPLTDLRLVRPGLADGYPGLRAMPVRLPDPGAVALLRVGDRIDLIAVDPEGGSAASLAAGVPVLALPGAGPDTDIGPSGPVGLPGALVVLGVSAEQAHGVAAAAVGRYLAFTLAD